MFDSHYLARAIQLGRVKQQNKPIFIAKIPVFEEAFKKGRLPRLQWFLYPSCLIKGLGRRSDII